MEAADGRIFENTRVTAIDRDRRWRAHGELLLAVRDDAAFERGLDFLDLVNLLYCRHLCARLGTHVAGVC